MANFFLDNKDLQYHMNHPLMKRIVELKEKGYADKDLYDYAPTDFEDAQDSYRRVMEIIGEVCGDVIAPNAEGGFDKIPQLGNVIIEDDVEIGANTCIDRAKTDSTIIRRGVKLDNLIASKQAEVSDLDQQIEEAERKAAEEELKRQQEEAARQAAEAARQQAASNRNNSSSSSSNSSSNSNKGNSSNKGTSNNAPSYVSGDAVSRAKSALGKPYVWGATGPNSFDCSGLVGFCLTGRYSRSCTSASLNALPTVSNPQPGDVCVRSGHCGIYIGNGQMIHAPHTGDVVKVASVPSNMRIVRP